MKIITQDTNWAYDLVHIARIFEKDSTQATQASGEGIMFSVEGVGDIRTLRLSEDGRTVSKLECAAEKWVVKSEAYRLLSEYFGDTSPYGILVGVRPVKVVHTMLAEGLASADILAKLTGFFHLHPDKAALLLEVARTEAPFLDTDNDKLSLYLGIPFCPSLCAYCTFPSNDMHRKGHLMEPFLDKLLEEIDHTAQLIRTHGRDVDVIYIGGGTPTSLDPDQMERLLAALGHAFDLASLKEFTVEAGRPETLSKEMLLVLKRHHVNRICLNPQTFTDDVLRNIGRLHTAADILEKHALVSGAGFGSLNMDLIAGLPGETKDSFHKTLETVLRLRPENITVHTLAMKKASRLTREGAALDEVDSETLERMLRMAEEMLRRSGYRPYYLYRQKNIIGNFENIGYALDGCESVYNIRIIEEKHPILALGVGGVSKRVYADHETFDRIPNYRSVEAYIEDNGEMARRKARFFALTDGE